MKVFSVLLLAVFLLNMLAIPADATAPTLPKVSMDASGGTELPANLGSIIGLVLAVLMVAVVIVIVILKKRK